MSRFSDRDRTESVPLASRLSSKRGQIEVVHGPDAGMVLPFEDRVRVGGMRVADVVLADPKVSAIHCELTITDEIWLRDLGSKNGTFIGGCRVREAALSAGESFRVGDTRIRVRSLGAGGEIPLAKPGEYFGVVGQSEPMRALIAKLELLASNDSTVLIQGDTGTGKEVIAEALHLSGQRAGRPLVVVDCGSLPTDLVESELFGHEKGAFTGAHARRLGAFERAHSGTVFLDELGELPLELQPKLLRVIEGRQVRRLGGDRPQAVDVRILAATHRDLALEVARGRFREDLYYRLAVVTLRVPALRDRIDDIVPLSIHLLEQLGADPAAVLTQEVIAALESFEWPGNVRQLRNVLERAVTLTEPIVAGDLPAPTRRDASSSDEARFQVDMSLPFRTGKARIIAEYERAYLARLMQACKGNISEVARRAGMDRMSIHRMLQRSKRKSDGSSDE
jgi:transcriptional regulator with GAF, ATPase, and Fis domain